jgi:hypothetical protein
LFPRNVGTIWRYIPEYRTLHDHRCVNVKPYKVFRVQNYWVFGLWPSSGVLDILENTTLRKLDLFPSSGEGEDMYSVGKQIQFSKRFCFLVSGIPDDGQSPKTQ